MCDIIMSAKSRKRAQPRKSEILQDLAVDMSPMIELYVSLFSKHIYYNPTIDRDLQIIILPSQTQTVAADKSSKDPFVKESASFSNINMPATFGNNSCHGML
jgi:hypothetical protein